MARNLLVAMAGLVSNQPRDQLAIVVIIVTVFLTATGEYAPWRAISLNHFDVGTSFLLAQLGIFCTLFLSLAKENALAVKYDNTEVPIVNRESVETYTVILQVLIALFLLAFAAIVFWSANGMRVTVRLAAIQASDAVVQDLFEMFEMILQLGDLEERCKDFLLDATDYDRRHFKAFLTRLQHDPNQLGTSLSLEGSGRRSSIHGRAGHMMAGFQHMMAGEGLQAMGDHARASGVFGAHSSTARQSKGSPMNASGRGGKAVRGSAWDQPTSPKHNEPSVRQVGDASPRVHPAPDSDAVEELTSPKTPLTQ